MLHDGASSLGSTPGAACWGIPGLGLRCSAAAGTNAAAGAAAFLTLRALRGAVSATPTRPVLHRVHSSGGSEDKGTGAIPELQRRLDLADVVRAAAGRRRKEDVGERAALGGGVLCARGNAERLQPAGAAWTAKSVSSPGGEPACSGQDHCSHPPCVVVGGVGLAHNRALAVVIKPELAKVTAQHSRTHNQEAAAARSGCGAIRARSRQDARRRRHHLALWSDRSRQLRATVVAGSLPEGEREALRHCYPHSPQPGRRRLTRPTGRLHGEMTESMQEYASGHNAPLLCRPIPIAASGAATATARASASSMATHLCQSMSSPPVCGSCTS